MRKIKWCGGVMVLLMAVATINLTHTPAGSTITSLAIETPTETPTPIAYTTLWKIKNMAITGEAPDKKFSFDIYTAFMGTPTDYKICAHSLRVLYDNAELESPTVSTGLSMFYADWGEIDRWDNLDYFYLTPMDVISGGIIVELCDGITWGEYAKQGYTSSLLPLLSTDGEQMLCRVEFDIIHDDTFTFEAAGIDWDRASYGSPPHFDSTVSNKNTDENCGEISGGATYQIETPLPTNTPTQTPTMSPTGTPTTPPTSTPSKTPTPHCKTPTPTVSPTRTPTRTPTPHCKTPTPTVTPALTPTPTRTPAFGLMLETKIFLEGAYTGWTPPMYTTLQALGYLPTTSPYADRRVVNPLPPNVVDWVYIQLRTSYNGPAVVERSAFVRNDGRVIDDDGDTVVKIAYPTNGYYYVVVRHRNHLAVMSRVPIKLGTGSSMLYDFTDSQNKAYGYRAMKDLGGRKYGLVAGDVAWEFGIVDISDLRAIELDLGKAGYLLTDARLQGTVDWSDWAMCYNNYGRVTRVPQSKGRMRKRPGP